VTVGDVSHDRTTRGVVLLLTFQALAFGITMALLLVPANALFLDEYGSTWLPATYIAIAVIGIPTSAVAASAVRRFALVGVAAAVLGAFAAVFFGSWLVLVAGGSWISALLVVSFPILIQMGFVFIGGQAGRMLDVRQIKVLFPRIVLGFAVGFLVGGLAGIPLLALLGSTRNLLLATTAFEIIFLGLLLLTWRRHPVALSQHDTDEPVGGPRLPLRQLLTQPFVLLVFAYQVLSAMGTQVVDFLFFDRASHRYTGDEMTRFLAQYTVVVNLVDILFLALLAGFLLQRFGVRFGLVANPAVVTVLLGAMVVPLTLVGGGSLGLFTLAALARISDITLTDGTTRTSINAAYQVLPVDERLAVQASVEGIGVPAAIGISGALLLGLQLLPSPLTAVIVFAVVLCAGWTMVAFAVSRAYRRSLAATLQRRLLTDHILDLEEEAEANAIRVLLRSDDGGEVRLGLDLVAGVASPAVAAEIARLADDARPSVRLGALARLVVLDASTGERLATEIAAAASSTEPADRRAAAGALGLVGGDRTILVQLLIDDDVTGRLAALSSVGPDDGATVDRVVAALGNTASAATAGRALSRLGQVAAPAVAALLSAGSPPTPTALRLMRACRACDDEATRVGLRKRIDDDDRVVSLAALDALRGSTVDESLAAALDHVLHDGAAHAARALAALHSLGVPPNHPPDHPLRRALADEVDMARRRVVAALEVRHGLGASAAVQALESPDRNRRALALESLEVTLTRAEAFLVLPLVRPDLSIDDRLAALAGAVDVPKRDRREWLDDLIADRDRSWRSPWLQTCAEASGRFGDEFV
jgi:hypothetical protein